MLIDSDFTTLLNDRWKAPIPVVSAKNTLLFPSGKLFVVMDFDLPGVLNTESKDIVNDIYFRPDSDLQKVVRPGVVMPSNVSSGGSFAFTGRYPRLYTFIGDGDQEEFSVPYGSTRLEILVPPIDGGTPTYRQVHKQPFLWYEIDLAELLFAWTRFHSLGGSGMAELDELTFKSYSFSAINILNRQRFTVIREVEKSISQQVKSIVDQSNAIVGYGRHDGANGLSFLLTLREFHSLEDNAAIYETAIGRESFLVARPNVRFADDQVANRSAYKFGSGVRLTGIKENETYAPSTSSPISAPEEENTIRQEIDASVTKLGLRPVDPTARKNAVSEQSAEGNFDLHRWDALRREVDFALGPLHFDFCSGDIIHLEDDLLGLSGTEDLAVTRKTYNWDTLFATVSAREIDLSAGVSMDPSEIDSGAELVGWFKGDAGQILAVAPTLARWENQAGTAIAPHLTAPTRGVANTPQKLTNHRNGKDAVDFRVTSGSIPTCFDWSWTSGEESWTFFFCGTFDIRSGSVLQSIIDSVGGASGGFGILAADGTQAKYGFYDGVNSFGPGVDTDPETGILMVQLFRTRGNYALAGDERCFVQFSPFTAAAEKTADDPQTVRPNELALSQSFGDDSTLSNVDVKLRGFSGDTTFGGDSGMTQDAGNFISFEWCALRHAKGIRPLRSFEIRGIDRYLRDRWE